MSEETKQVKLVLTVTVPKNQQEHRVIEVLNNVINQDERDFWQNWHVGQVLPAPDVTVYGYKNYETAMTILWLQNNKEAMLRARNHVTGLQGTRGEDAETLKQWVISNSPHAKSPFTEYISAGISETDWYEVLDSLTDQG